VALIWRNRFAPGVSSIIIGGDEGIYNFDGMDWEVELKEEV
jgi:hypothetical protein